MRLTIAIVAETPGLSRASSVAGKVWFDGPRSPVSVPPAQATRRFAAPVVAADALNAQFERLVLRTTMIISYSVMFHA